ncbi:hypothetical protein BOX15_Mlig017029g2 [Macrostomum lignano]|uniref:PPM-type phosphatase domain-containing protein n=1 Tax=Macrostomum lignano TaxID=282301 RepID=A0A267GBT9_9PLAT|nr:hypothetical protein BOX15_Mlig017029g2 [Macrostomum lignano]
MNGAAKLVRPRRQSQNELLVQPMLNFSRAGGSGNGLSYGVCTVQGYRPHMEDRYTARASVRTGHPVYGQASFFAVYDGHGGDWVSTFCVREKCSFLDFLIEDEQLTSLLAQQSPICDYRDCLRRLFLGYDRKIRREIDYQRNRADSCGSTAVVLLICRRHLLLANCGDSRGVVYIDYGNYYNRVTVDHSVAHILNKELSTVEIRTERQRFDGLRYEMDRDRGLRKPHDKLGHGLMVTRAFGDYDFKGDDLHNLVTAEPSINHGTYFVKGHERLAALASDGLWDVFTTEEVCEFALHQLKRRSSVQTVARDLLQCALEAGSRDNLTLVLVCFDKNIELALPQDVGQLRDETDRLADAVAREDLARATTETEVQQLAQRLAAKMVRITSEAVFGEQDAGSGQQQPAQRCFSRVCYFFWLRRARQRLRRALGDPGLPALDEANDDDGEDED